MNGQLDGVRAVIVNWRDLGHSLAGGSEIYAWEFAQALREAGASVEFITSRDEGQSATEVIDGIPVHRAGGALTFYAFAAWSLLRRRRRLDVVIDPECGIPCFSPLFVRRSTAVVLTVHHVHQEQFGTYLPGPLALLGRLLERVAMPLVYRRRRVLAVSPSTHTEMVRQLGWRGPVEILANGTDHSLAEDARVADKDPERIVVLGRLVPHKRIELALRAVAELRHERPGLHVDVCGRGPDRERLEGLAAELGISDRVTFHGFVGEETKSALLRRAALQICGSDVEGWGQVVIEAAGYGVPTIARDVPGLRDSIRDGHTGWLVPDHEDLDVVSERITAQVRLALRSLDEPEGRTLTFKACRAWAERFSWVRMRAEARRIVCEELRRPAAQRHRRLATVPSSD